MKKILVAIDGSEHSLRAVRVAASIAKATGAKLFLAHVKVAAWPTNFYGLPPDEYRQQEQLLLTEMFDQALDLTEAIETERCLLEGKPAEELASAAIELNVDMVVVGSRGRGAVQRVLLGSVSSRLVHICDRPVVVVP